MCKPPFSQTLKTGGAGRERVEKRCSLIISADFWKVRKFFG